MKKFLQKLFDALLVLTTLFLGIWVIGVAVWMWNFTGAKLWLWGMALISMWICGFAVKRAHWMLLGLEGAVLIFFIILTPEKAFEKQQWIESCSRLPEVVRKDDKLVIRNVRVFKYRTTTDFDRIYRTLEVDPEKLESMDIYFSFWDEMYEVGHMMLGFNFSDGQRLIAAIEPRVKPGYYSGDFFWGVYKQYGMFILLSVPEDVCRLRSHYRGETMFCYRTAAKGEVLKKMFARTMKRVEELHKKTEFYHTVSHSCTTGFLDILSVEPALCGWDWRQYINGFYAEYLFERGFLEHREGESFGSLQARSLVPGLSRGKGK